MYDGERGTRETMGERELEHRRGPVPVFNTSELRWFAQGSAPRDVVAWFSATGAAPHVEKRTDVYQLHGVDGLGVKVRGGSILEVKRLESVGDVVDLGLGLSAPLTRWSKTRPFADDAAWASGDVPSVAVSKRIMKRSYGVEGPAQDVMGLAGAQSMPGCNVEITLVWVGDIESWTFAFEAYGDLGRRRTLITGAWAALTAEAMPPPAFAKRLGVAADYSRWLEAAAAAGSWAVTASNSGRGVNRRRGSLGVA